MAIKAIHPTLRLSPCPLSCLRLALGIRDHVNDVQRMVHWVVGQPYLRHVMGRSRDGNIYGCQYNQH